MDFNRAKTCTDLYIYIIFERIMIFAARDGFIALLVNTYDRYLTVSHQTEEEEALGINTIMSILKWIIDSFLFQSVEENRLTYKAYRNLMVIFLGAIAPFTTIATG